MRFSKIIVLFLLCSFLQSCTKDVDFNQLDQADAQSVYLVTLIHLNLTATNFLDDINKEIPLLTDVVRTPITKEAEPYVEKVEITILTQNSFNRDFAFNFVFYDGFKNSIYTIQPTITVPSNSGETTKVIEILKGDLSNIYNAQFIGAYLDLLPSNDGSYLTISDEGTLNLKSSAKIYLNYKIK